MMRSEENVIMDRGNWVLFVCMYVPENGVDSHKQKTKMKLSANGEMTVKWKMTGGKDKENHKFEAESAQFHFFWINVKYRLFL